jgi:3-hydroxymyristoyl/3-hydroxydecanoyl-(acyl carrier protein) dehydratase
VGATPRLTAIAVAPGLTTAAILAALRGRIDAAFLPRPLHLVDTLPRNALGKLARSDMLRLIGPAPAAPAAIDRDPAETVAGPGSASGAAPVKLHFPADHPTGPGHFPGNPVIPGAILLDELVAALFPGDGCGAVLSAKFHHPVRPGDTVAVSHRTEGEATRFEGRLLENAQLVLSGVLRAPFPPR